jgi:type IV pilus assembly protein PilC
MAPPLLFSFGMLTFAYQARDNNGRVVSGVQEGLNEENAISTLMGRGLMVLSIQQKGASKMVRARAKVSDSDLVIFTRQLATMVDAGLPLVASMTALFEQTDGKKQAGLRRVIGEVTSSVQEGSTFNEAVAKHPQVFNRLYIAMVKAGESGGMLAGVLDRLAGFLEASARLRKKVKSAMTYPVIVISIALLITTFLIVKVVPVFAGIFADFGQKLPAPTQFLIDLSEFMRGYWYFIIGGIIGAVYAIRAWVKSKKGAETWDRWKLKMPVFGPLTHKICMTRFARTFAQLIRAGVPILEVMQIVGDTAGNSVVTNALKGVATDIEKGDTLTAALTRQPIFPPMLLRMVSAGESTGKIDAMLEKMADFWDEEIEATLAALTSLLEPLLIVVLGIIVGGIVIAMFLPIFKLNDVVSANK